MSFNDDSCRLREEWYFGLQYEDNKVSSDSNFLITASGTLRWDIFVWVLVSGYYYNSVNNHQQAHNFLFHFPSCSIKFF